jgi:hypothetical protein
MKKKNQIECDKIKKKTGIGIAMRLNVLWVQLYFSTDLNAIP